jgi:ectoine hydroxylase-related dioxygenase (phytanoyl-CoA dioxygenase family)
LSSMRATTQAVAHYRETGHAVLRDILDRERVGRIQRQIARQFSMSGVTDGSITGRGQLRYIAREYERPEDFLLEVTARSQDLEALYHTHAVRDAVSAILNHDEVFVHPLKHLRAVPPEISPLSFPAGEHQDFPELQGSMSQLTMWTPLFRTMPDTGSLPVFRRDRDSVMPMKLAENPSGWAIDKTFLVGEVRYDLHPGDVLVFNTFTPHGGARNRGDGVRVSAEARFQPLADPVAEGVLASPLIAESWAAHYEGWPEELAYYWRERHPSTVPFDDTWERWRDIMAVDEARRGNDDAYQALVIAAQFARNEPTRREAKRLLGST